jgi:hypothetical protein
VGRTRKQNAFSSLEVCGIGVIKFDVVMAVLTM